MRFHFEFFMRQQFHENLELLENILWKCRSINRPVINRGRCKISSVNALIWRFFFRNFVISCFQEFRKWLQHSIFSGNFTRVEKSWILFKTKFKSSITNINYLAPLFMHCYSCSKITIQVLLSPRHLKWHIWLRVRGCAYVWLLQIYTRFWILITSLPPIFSGKVFLINSWDGLFSGLLIFPEFLEILYFD